MAPASSLRLCLWLAVCRVQPISLGHVNMTYLTCLMCGNRIIPAGIGRPPRWCSTPCRYRAHNRLRHLRVKRARAQADGLERRAAYLTEWIDRLETTNA